MAAQKNQESVSQVSPHELMGATDWIQVVQVFSFQNILATPVIPATWPAEIRRIRVQGKKLVSKTLSQQIGWTWWVTSVSPATQEAEVGGSQSKTGLHKQCESLCG
jgi:hypothetical protein